MSADEPVLFDEDNPEWTGEDFARALRGDEIPASVRQAFGRGRGRPALDEDARKQKVNLRLSPDVLTALRAGGRGWQTRVDEILRRAVLGGKR